MQRTKCLECGVYTSNEDHQCIQYNGPPCETPGCEAPTVFVMIGAPGIGQGRQCKAGHYHGTCRELTIADVI
jgi:hypothetical protein